MSRLLMILAALAVFLAYPRAALMIAVVVATGCVLAVRWLLCHRTVFAHGRARWA
jgi:hypothetical protein